MTKRLYVGPDVLTAGAFELDAAVAHRLKNVLRVRPGDELILFDGEGTDARVRVDDAGRALSVTVLESMDSPAEPRLRLHLYQSITKGERFEWLLEKATEVGAHRIVPLVAARAVVKTGAEAAKVDRWRRIVVEAAEQSGRGAIPLLDAPQPFTTAIASAPGIILLPYEAADDSAPDIPSALSSDIDALFALEEASVFIGPEGGYEPSEVEAARAAGAHIVTMGQRVLRSETAGLVAATLVLHAAGALG